MDAITRINPAYASTSIPALNPHWIRKNDIMIMMNAMVSPPSLVLKKLFSFSCLLLSYHSYTTAVKNTTKPITTVVPMAIGMIFFKTSPSFPRIPAVVVPRIILLGLIAAPMAPPAV